MTPRTCSCMPLPPSVTVRAGSTAIAGDGGISMRARRVDSARARDRSRIAPPHPPSRRAKATQASGHAVLPATYRRSLGRSAVISSPGRSSCCGRVFLRLDERTVELGEEGREDGRQEDVLELQHVSVEAAIAATMSVDVEKEHAPRAGLHRLRPADAREERLRRLREPFVPSRLEAFGGSDSRTLTFCQAVCEPSEHRMDRVLAPARRWGDDATAHGGRAARGARRMVERVGDAEPAASATVASRVAVSQRFDQRRGRCEPRDACRMMTAVTVPGYARTSTEYGYSEHIAKW